MKYTLVSNSNQKKVKPMKKSAFKPAWDPYGVDYDGTEFAFDSTNVDTTIYQELKKHYAKLLAKAYFKSTGKHLSKPESKIDPRYSYAMGRAANVDPEILKQLSPYYYQRLGGWASKMVEPSPGLVADTVDSINQRRSWVPLMRQPGDTREIASELSLPRHENLAVALVGNKKKASEEEPQDIDWEEVARQVQEYRNQNELGTWGAFKKSIPISLLVAGLSGVAGTAFSGNIGVGAALGGISGLATSALNTINNRHALPEEAGTSFFATF